MNILRYALEDGHFGNLDMWFREIENRKCTIPTVFAAAKLLEKILPDSIINALTEIGTSESKYVGIVLEGLFTVKHPVLALIVHEALSHHLLGVKDINYPYESHKLLYPKPEGVHYSEWGQGSKAISPHSDDLYEAIDIDILCLTVCKDETNCGTRVYECQELVNTLSDCEQQVLKTLEATYVSGKNVKHHILKRKRKVVQVKGSEMRYNLDFRVDKDMGKRMYSDVAVQQRLLDKLKDNVARCPYFCCMGKPGTFIAIDNGKAIHARGELPTKLPLSDDLFKTHRLLFRSKGQKVKFLKLGLH